MTISQRRPRSLSLLLLLVFLTAITTFVLGKSSIGKTITYDTRYDKSIAAGNFTGTLILGAYTLISAGGYDAFIVQYNLSGIVDWAVSISGSGDEDITGLSYDPTTGHVYAYGTFSSSTIQIANSTNTLSRVGDGADLFITKIDPRNETNDRIIWKVAYGGSGYEISKKIAVSSGKIFITGGFNSSTITFDQQYINQGGFDMFIVQLYTVNGTVMFATTTGGPGDEIGYGILAGPVGLKFWVTGSFQKTAMFDLGVTSIPMTSKGSDDIFVIFYWNQTVQSVIQAGGIGSDIGRTITFTPSSDVAVGGDFNSPIFNFTGFTSNGLVNTVFDNSTRDGFIMRISQNMSLMGPLVQVTGLGDEYIFDLKSDDAFLYAVGATNSSTTLFGPTSTSAPNTIVNNAGSDLYFSEFDIEAANGPANWAVRYGGNGTDVGSSSVINGTSHYVTGYFNSLTPTFGSSIATNPNPLNNAFFEIKLSSVDNCASSPCQNGATCVNGYNSFSCSCANGFVGTLCQTNVCASSPCQNGGTCVGAPAGTFTCTCPSGFGGTLCVTVLVTPPALRSLTCVGVLASTAINNVGPTIITGNLAENPGTWITGFPPGLVLGTTHTNDATSAAALNDLTNAYNDANNRNPTVNATGGEFGGTTFAPGIFNITGPFLVSLNNITLDAKGLPGAVWIFQISQFLQFSNQTEVVLTNGAQSDNVFWQVDTSATIGNGSIVYGSIMANTFITMNTSAYLNGRALSLTNAITLQQNNINVTDFINNGCPTSFCLSSPCQNGGTCNDGIGNFTCTCVPNFSGTICQTYNSCVSNPCQNGGTCHLANDTSYNCSCAAGFNGYTCSNQINNCLSFPCLGGGTCLNGINSFQCICPSTPIYGTLCQFNNTCLLIPCQNGATCNPNNSTGTFTCSCAPGFNQTLCDHQIDNCGSTHGPCQNNGTCLNGVNSYFCSCVAGYNGTNCQNQINYCSSNPCQNGASCLEGVNSYYCLCAAGFSGTICQTQNNNCASYPCLNGGTCMNGIDSFFCSCPPGFTGSICNIHNPVFVNCTVESIGNTGFHFHNCTFNILNTSLLNPDIQIVRGNTYFFFLAQSGQHQFYIKSAQTGGTGNQYLLGISGNGGVPGPVAWTVADSAPNILYYIDPLHTAETGRFLISGAGSLPLFQASSCFALLASGIIVINGSSTVKGEVGAGVTIYTQPLTTVNGLLHINDQSYTDAQSDSINVAIALASKTCEIDLTGQNLGGMTLTAHTYCFSGNAALNGTLILDAMADGKGSVFVIQIAGGLVVGQDSIVRLQGQATGCNVFWGVFGDLYIDKRAIVLGNIIIEGSAIIQTNVSITGRVQTPNGNIQLSTGVVMENCTTICNADINACASSPCSNGGSCTARVGGFTCSCQPGFTGTRCASLVNNCASNPCKNGASCLNGINSFSCSCANGYNNTLCDNQIDNCGLLAPCLNGGNCTNGIGTYNCSCVVPWVGNNCQYNNSKCAKICVANVVEGDTLFLDCGPNTIDQITFVSYGTPQGICGSLHTSICDSTTAPGIVLNDCKGENNCSELVTSANFDDPCDGEPKWMSVEALCNCPRIFRRTVTSSSSSSSSTASSNSSTALSSTTTTSSSVLSGGVIAAIVIGAVLVSVGIGVGIPALINSFSPNVVPYTKTN